MAISRMQQPRQMYGLGSIVKKAVRGVKKIAKSDLGKAALLYAGGAYLGGSTMMGGSGGSFMSRMASPGNLMNLVRNTNNTGIGQILGRGIGNFRSGAEGTKMGSLSNLFRQSTKRADGTYSGQGNPFSLGKLALGGLGVASLAPLFMKGGDGEEETVVEQIDPAAQVQRAKNYYSGMGDKGVGLNFMPKKKYVSQNFYAADGGRAGYANGGYLDEDDEDYIRSAAGQSRRQHAAFLNMGGGAGEAQAEQMLMAEFIKYKNKGGDLSFEQFVKAVMQQQEQAQDMQQPMMAANGGRIGYSKGGGPFSELEIFKLKNLGYDIGSKGTEPFGGVKVLKEILRVNKAEGGIMETDEASEMIDMGGQEKDYRETGGFVEMGGEERADDVPARLSKNEFVFTADAVRNAGGGDIDRGSEVMQNLMDNLEQGGQVSEDSQGLGGEEMMMSEEMIEEPNGAQAMYEQQQALQSRMI